MNAVKSPIHPSNSGKDVVNLQDALLLLIEKGLIQLPSESSHSSPHTLLTELRRDRDAGAYRGGTTNLVILFREQYKDRFHLTPGGDVDAPTADALNTLLQELGAFKAEPSKFVIGGHVTDTDKKGLAEHALLLSEYDVDGTTLIGRTKSKTDGAFEFVFDFKEALKTGDGDTAPDLVFQVLDTAGATRPIGSIFILDGGKETLVPKLAESEGAPIVLMNVPPELDLRVVIDWDQKALTEFEQLVARLKPFMRKVGFADLKEDEANFQISFLSRESGVEKAKIGQVRDAFQHADQAGNVPAWSFFCLSTQSIDIANVRSMTTERLISVLKPAQPASDKQKLEVIVKHLQEYAGEQNVLNKTAALKSSLTTLLQPILGSGNKLNAFFEAYARHEGDIESFWKEVGKKSSFKEDVPKIQLNLQLMQLTLGNQGLITALQRRGIENTRQLVDIPAEDWEAMILHSKEDIPPHISGENDRTRAKTYSRELQMLVERAFPTDVIKKNLRQPEASAFLKKNPEFDFLRDPVDSYLHRQEDKLLGKKENREELKTQLRRIQRTYAVTGNAIDMNHLLEMKFDSAHQIAKLTPSDFAQSVKGKISEETAYQYHNNAVAISNEVAMVYQMLRDHRTERTAAIKGFGPYEKLLSPAPDDVSEDTAAGKGSSPDEDLLDDRIPDWRILFGSLDMCECEHCKSVYSPAAYFVDLLHILLGRRDRAPRKELFRRRPDLKYTKLTCEHTETLIPYIDLVNEVLQTYVANSDVGNPNADTHASKSTNDTSNLSEADLAANPQYPNEGSQKDATKAYDLLRDKATYPLNLPFDMHLETGRQFLEEQKSSRFEVMHMLGTPASFATAAERLKISKREFEILTLKQLDGTSNAGIKIAENLWGDPEITAGTTLGDALSRVDIFIATAGIAYTDLISLLKTRFLNKNFPINTYLQELTESERTAWATGHPNENKLALSVIELGATDDEQPCNLSTTLIRHLNGNALSEEELSLVNRFIRLWKKLGCTIPELDSLLVALGVSDITPKVIKDLSGLWQINHLLELPLERVAVLAGPIQTAGKDSLFARLFLNKAILQIDDKFRLNVLQDELEDKKELLKNHVPAILAAMQITEEDFNRILAFSGLTLATAPLNIANLSKLYRYVIFAQGLKIQVKDLFIWLDLISASPWTTVADLVKIHDALFKLINYGFSATDFAYVFENARSFGSSLPPTEEVINQSAKTLREGLLKIRQENTLKDNQVAAAFLKAKLGIILEEEETTRIIGILDGTNTQDNATYLLTPRVSENYKGILTSYLTTAEVNSINAIKDVPERLKKYWSKIELKLVPLLRRTFIQQHIIATFKSDAAFVALILQDAAILQTCLDMEADTPAHALAYNKLYIQLFKSLWLIDQLKLSAEELAYFQKNPSFANFDWKALNFPAWLRVADFVALRDKLPSAEFDLISIFQTAKKSGDIVKAIVAVTDWDEVNVAYFVSKHTPSDFLNEISLVLLQQEIELSERIGVSIQKLHGWATDTVDKDQAQDIKRTLKAKYDEQGWIEISTKIYNRLRSLLRDALVGYLLQKQEIKSLGVKDAYDLYGYFLIDVEMDSCMLTSRLKQAIASVQLFVQRCLLNLESLKTDESQKVFPHDVNADQWKWMKNYRVWEGNRKVFLYPENWIEPELRDNKSPFFKELESELLQAEITNETAEQAFMKYLSKLHDVARLDICGIYEDTEGQELHVFGRTFNSPPQYFYRKLDLETQVWTAWESVQVDIQGCDEGPSAGVHLIPVVWNRRLYLFWPIFAEQRDKGKTDEDENQAYWEVRLAWTEYRQNRWTNKKLSQSFIRTDRLDPVSNFRFALTAGSTLTLRMINVVDATYAYGPGVLNLWKKGDYCLNCGGKVLVLPTEGMELLERIKRVVSVANINFYQAFLSNDWGWPDSIPLELQSYGTIDEILGGSEKKFQVLFPADHNVLNNFSSRFIYQDYKRAYYVEPLGGILDLIFALRDPSKATPDVYKAEILPFDLVDKGDPEQFNNSIRWDGRLTNSLDQLVDSGQIAASTAMQIRLQQDFALSDATESNLADKPSAKSLREISTPAGRAVDRATGRTSGTPPNATGSSASNAKSNELPPSLVKPKLRFNPFFHAYTCELMGALDGKNGIEGLLNISNQQYSDLVISGPIAKSNFYLTYDPTWNVERPLPLEIIDFSPTGAYSLYNWELFFHIPMLIANRLSNNQRFEEAMRWYHFIFNPTTSDNVSSPARYWQVLRFRNTPKETLQDLLGRLRLPVNDPKRIELEQAIAQWREHPFEPHCIARGRLIAYQKNVVMKYLDNLIAWGDALFGQDTIESINEATQLYILVALLLGKRVEKIPERGTIQAQNYDELEKKGLNSFSNALVQLETIFPFYNVSTNSFNNDGAAAILSTTGPSWYFCLPDNDKLLRYWDTIADRLFKIRHCQNIGGVERQLALFEPPIDPALLVRAVANGVDISSVLADLNSPRPVYRFSYIVQKALEICSDLKSLGNSLLSALEKKDSEALSIMRGRHETLLMSLTKTVRQLQIKESQRIREGLEQTRAITEYRAAYYTKLLSEGLNASEKEQQTLSQTSMFLSVAGQFLEMAASLAHPLPNVNAGVNGGQCGGPTYTASMASGDKAAKALSAFARFFNMASTVTNYHANAAATNAIYQRRDDEWKFQQDLAKQESSHIDKQILVAQIGEQIADKQMSNHEQQFENSKEAEEFLRSKYTQEQLYGWLIGELSTVYFQCYQLAYDLARKAEKTYRYELGISDSNFVQFGIWDSFRKGLLSGEKLYLSLKQMEKSYMDQNRREYEISKSISLLEHKPLALISLKETGTCILELPETLFDVDYPGHYMRRIKSVSLSIPCVAGPYTTVNCTLTLLSSKTRVSNIADNNYADDMNTGSVRVTSNYAATESIATSSAQNDSGMFELNFRDERYLPFEGAGAISLWRIELPKDFRQFDYDTVSDVILHMKYTAKEGGENLKGAALTSLKKVLKDEAKKPQARLFSLRHEFPTEWHRLQNVADASGDHIQAFPFTKNRFPFLFNSGKIKTNTIELFGVPNDRSNNLSPKLKVTLSGPDGKALALKPTGALGALAHQTVEAGIEVKNIDANKKGADWTIRVKKADVPSSLAQLQDIIVLCHYTVGMSS